MNINQLSVDIRNGDTTALARGITLVESSKLADWQKAKELIVSLSQKEYRSARLGFSGPPGAGKSTFIEKLGMEFIKRGGKVAVLAIDPSSEISGGSILGDKTRMENLSRHQNAFVRPSPSRGHLGGVTSSLPGVLLLCEAAGFDWILVESVGVGQSEVELSRMVDFFTLIAQPGAGDELQGIKKGILEYVDLIAVNKSDRDQSLVNITIQQFHAAIKILRKQEVKVKPCSALTGHGVGELANIYEHFFTNFPSQKRESFNLFWFQSLVYSEFKKILKHDPKISQLMEELKDEVKGKKTLPIEATEKLFKKINLQ